MTSDVYHKVYVMLRAFSHDVTRVHVSVPKPYNVAPFRNEFFYASEEQGKRKLHTHVIFHTK